VKILKKNGDENLKESELREIGQWMSIPYEEWRKQNLLERFAKCVPKIVEKYRAEMKKANLNIEEVRSYIIESASVLRKGEKDLEF
jgi:hypothetical protein